MIIVVKARIRMLFEIDPVDLRIDPLKKEEMMKTNDENHPATIHPHNNEEEEALDLRTNLFQKGGDDGRGPNTSPHASPPKGIFGPPTRVMAKRIQEDWNVATDGRKNLLIHVQMP